MSVEQVKAQSQHRQSLVDWFERSMLTALSDAADAGAPSLAYQLASAEVNYGRSMGHA